MLQTNIFRLPSCDVNALLNVCTLSLCCFYVLLTSVVSVYLLVGSVVSVFLLTGSGVSVHLLTGSVVSMYLLIGSVLSGDVVRLVAVFNSAKLIDQQLSKLMAASGENMC